MHDKRKLRKQERNKRIWSWVIVFLLVVSLGGFFIGGSGGSSQTVRYNGYRFQLTQEGITGKIDGKEYAFNFFPDQLESIPVDEGVTRLLNSPFIFMTYDAASNYSEGMALAQFNLGKIFSEELGAYIVLGTLDENEFGFPVISCVNATETQPVLAFVQDKKTSVSLVNNCIIATASNEVSLFQIHDRLLLQRLGVIE